MAGLPAVPSSSSSLVRSVSSLPVVVAAPNSKESPSAPALIPNADIAEAAATVLLPGVPAPGENAGKACASHEQMLPAFRSNAGPAAMVNNVESLDGLTSQWDNLSLSSDVEGGSYAFRDPVGDKVSAEFYLVGSMRAIENISPKLIEKAMSNAWSPRFGMEMKPVADNLYLFRFNHRLDINKVLREGPWRVKDYLLIVKETMPGYLIPREELMDAPFWVQIYGIPPLWHREEVIRFVGSLIGRVLEVDPKVRRSSPTSPMFVRVRVEINTLVKLVRGTTVELDDLPVPVAFRYERLFNFCYWCGLVDHVLAGCEEALKPGFSMDKCEYGDWLRGIPPRPTPWDSSPWKPVLPRGTMAPQPSGNPFARSGQSIPPGFRLMPRAPAPTLPSPPVRPALPAAPPVPPPAAQFAFQAQDSENGRKIYKRNKNVSVARDNEKGGKRRRGGGDSDSSGSLGASD